MSAFLAAERVHLRHPGADHDSVRDVSLAVEPGEILALVGPNGSGKSTLLAGLSSGLTPRAGRVLLDGVELRRLRRRKIARRIARLPQEPALVEGMSVDALVRQGRHPHVGTFSRASEQDRAAQRRALAAMELSDMRSRALETLSGGERRRAWIAMVLAQEPELLLLDEPTAALDLRQQWQVLALLAQINRERGIALVIALHDLAQAARIAHRVAVMHRGRLYQCGPPEACLTEATLCDVFGVDARIEKTDGEIQIRVQGTAVPLRSL
jgi:iron complex transport system ATP-binding protein